MAVTSVTTRPIAACRSDTARRFSPKRPRDREQCDDAERRLQLQHNSPETLRDYEPRHAAKRNAVCAPLVMQRPPLTQRRSDAVCGHPQAPSAGTGRQCLARSPSAPATLLTAKIVPVLPAVAQPVALLQPDRRRWRSAGRSMISPDSAFDLGMVGLVQFLPTALLVFVAGNAADRYRAQARGAGSASSPKR